MLGTPLVVVEQTFDPELDDLGVFLFPQFVQRRIAQMFVGFDDLNVLDGQVVITGGVLRHQIRTTNGRHDRQHRQDQIFGVAELGVKPQQSDVLFADVGQDGTDITLGQDDACAFILEDHVDNLFRRRKNILGLDGVTTHTMIDTIHLLQDFGETGLVLKTQEILQFQLRTGHEHLGTLVADTFQEIQDLFVKKGMDDVNVKFDVTHMSHTIFRVLLALDTPLGVFDRSHPFVIDGIGSIHFGGKDLTHGLFEDEFGRHDFKFDTIQLLGFQFHHLVFF